MDCRAVVSQCGKRLPTISAGTFADALGAVGCPTAASPDRVVGMQRLAGGLTIVDHVAVLDLRSRLKTAPML